MIKKLISNIIPFKKSQMPFKTSMDLCGLPVVTFCQGKKKFNFLLDTGSNSSIIDSNILSELKYTDASILSTVTGIEGGVEVVKACNITLSFDGKDYTYYYLIKDMKGAFSQVKQHTGVTLHGLLGSLFFEEFKYVLDFGKLIAYSKR